MKTIVKGAILALLAVAFIGAAEARPIHNNSSNSNNTFIIGETNITFTFGVADAGNAYVNRWPACTSGTLGGVPTTSTQGVGNISTGATLDTNGKSLVAGPYDFTCNAGFLATYRVSAVNPTYSVNIRSAAGGHYPEAITSIASGDSVTVNTSNNLNDFILNPTLANGVQIGGTNGPEQGTGFVFPCAVDLVMKQQGVNANKLAAKSRGSTATAFLAVVNGLPYTWTNNTTDIGSIAADVNRNHSTWLNLTPTTDFPAAKYDFTIVATSAGPCNGINTESAVLKTLTVTTSDVSFKADKTLVGINDIVTYTGTTSPFRNVTIELTAGSSRLASLVTLDADSFVATPVSFPNANTVGAINTALGLGNFQMNSTSNISVVSNAAGTFTVQVKYTDDGTFEMQAKGMTPAGIPDTSIQLQKVSVTVQEVAATLKTDKSTVFLGQDVLISGTVTAGQRVIVAINDKVEVMTQVQADKTYSYLWTAARTRTYSAGSVKINAWVCPQTVDENFGGAADGDDCDDTSLTFASASTPLAQVTGTDVKDGICEHGESTYNVKSNTAGATATIGTGCDNSRKKSSTAAWSLNMEDQKTILTNPTPGQQVAEDDVLNIKGASLGAPGNKVFLWIFNTKGTTSGGTCYSNSIGTTSAEGGFTFEKVLGKSEVTDDVGTYTLAIQSLGRDGVYSDGKQTTSATGTTDDNDPLETGLGIGAIANTNLGCADDNGVTGSVFNNKQADQIRSFLTDFAKTKAGTDDSTVFVTFDFQVVSPSIRLNTCGTSVTKSALNVTGTSNRAENSDIIVKTTLPKVLSPQTVKVKNGTFSASFPAAELTDVGDYTVIADDLKGRTDTATCKVISGSACALTVAVKSSKTQVEKDEKAALTATVSNLGDEACTGTTLTTTATPSAGATLTWAKTSVDVPSKASADVTGNFSASADGSYTVAVEAKRGTTMANGSVAIGVGKVPVTPTGVTPAPTTTPTTTAPPATPKPSPGFEAVFAVAGLLAVAYLVNRRKR